MLFAQASSTGTTLLVVLLVLISLAFSIFYVACLWKVFTKAGEPGWHAVVPILNTYTLLKITGRPTWWIVLFLIPVVNAVLGIIVMIDLAKSFGKDPIYGLGLAFLGVVFLPMLAFGSSEYAGPAAAQALGASAHGYGYGAPGDPSAGYGQGHPGQGPPGQGYVGPPGTPQQYGQSASPTPSPAPTPPPASAGPASPIAYGGAASAGAPTAGPSDPTALAPRPGAAPAPSPPVAPATGPPAGWYPDPDGSGGQRWWDGTAWTEHRHPA